MVSRVKGVAIALAMAGCTSSTVAVGTAHAGLLGGLLSPPATTPSTTPPPATGGGLLGGVVSGLAGTVGQVTGGVTGTGTTGPATGTVGQVLAPLTGTANVVTGLGGGLLGLPALTEGLLCPPVSQIAAAVKATPLNPITSGVTSLVCSASLLQYRFVTTFQRADGSILERTQAATLGVPTALDVDDDLLPDLTGTITFTGLNTIGLKVDRLPTETAALPVQVEAVLSDTTTHVLGRDRLAFGYDARGDRAPGGFTLSTPIATLLGSAQEFRFDVAQTGRGEKVAIVGGVFDGTPQARVNPTELRLAYGKSPDAASVTAKLAGETAVRLTTNRPGRTVLSGRIVDGARQDKLSADIADLPTTLGVSLGGGSQLNAAYDASARVARIQASLERTNGTALVQQALLDLTDVPTGLTVTQSGDGGAVTTSGGPLGRAKVGIAQNGAARFLDGEAAYVSNEHDGAFTSTTALVPGLERATFALGDVPRISAKLRSTPFLVRLREPARKVDARLLDLPSTVDLSLDLGAGGVSFDGHGDGIAKLLLDVTAAQPVVGRATDVKGTVTGIPASLQLAFGQEQGRLNVTASNPIGSIDLAAANRPVVDADRIAGTHQGIRYVDTASDYVVAARVNGLKAIGAGLGDQIQVSAETAGGFFTADVTTDDLTAEARVADLAPKAVITADPGQGRVTYSGRTAAGAPQGIDALDLALRSARPLFGRVDRVNAHLERIPADLTLDVAQDGGGAKVVASDAIGLVELTAGNRDALPTDLPANGEQGAKIVDKTGGVFALGARLKELKRLEAQLDGKIRLVAETVGGPFTVRAETDSLTADARIEDLPARLTATLDPDAGRLTTDGRAADGTPQRIGRVVAAVDGTRPIVGRAKHLRAEVRDIPAALTLDLAQDGQGAAVTASEPIGSIEVAAGSAPVDLATALPAGDQQGVQYTDAADFLVGARVRQLKSLSAAFGSGPARVQAETAGGPFGLRVDTGGLVAGARLEDLPAKLDATLDAAQGKLVVKGRTADDQPQPIGLLTADVHSDRPLFGRATDVAAKVAGIPADLTLDVAQSGAGARVAASDTIDRIELVAASRRPEASDLPLDDEQGAKLTDRAGGDYVLAARLKHFKELSADFGSPLTVTAQTEGGPFGVRLDTDTVSGLARIEDLPATFTARVDLNAGKLALTGRDAAGERQDIGRIGIDLQADQPLFGRAKYVSANLVGIPGDLVLDLAQDGDGARVEASEPVGRIELVAASRPVEAGDLPANDAQGAKLADRSGADYVLAARLKQLKRLEAHFGDVITVGTETEGGPFGVRVDTDATRVSGRIEDLPAQLEAVVDLAAGKITLDGKNADGSAAAPIRRLALTADGDTPLFGRATDISAELKDVPAHVVLDLAQEGTGVRLEATPQIGSVEVVAADRDITDPAADLPSDQGAIYTDTPGRFLVAARVLDLKKVVAKLDDTITLVAQTRGGPFRVQAQTGGLDADVSLEDLPADVDVRFDPASGTLHYAGKDAQGNPAGIDETTLKLTSAAPVFGRATRVDATIRRLAPVVDLAIDPAGRAANVTASAPIEELSILATDAPAGTDVADLADGEQGAILHDTAGEPYVLRARLYDLKEIALDLGDDLGITANLRSTPFTIDAETAALTAQARIDKLPAQTRLGVDLARGGFTYSGKDAGGNPVGVDDITFSARGDQPIAGRARVVKGHLAQVPSDLRVAFDTEAGNAGVTLPQGAQLGALEIVLSDGQDTDYPAGQGLTYHDNAAEFRVAARILGLQKLDVGLQDSVGLTLDRTAGSRFTADVDIADVLTAGLDIQDLPARARFGLDLEGNDPANPNALTFTGRDGNGAPAGIGTLDISASTSQPIFGGGKYVQGHIERLPADVSIGFSQENGRASVNATGPDPVGRVELAASDTPGAFEYPTDENGGPAQGAILHEKAGEPFRVGLRILDLQQLQIEFGDAVQLKTRTAGGPFLADVRTDAFQAKARILDLPRELDLGLDLEGGQVTYTGSAGIGRITAELSGDEPLFLGATGVELDLKDVPSAFTIGLAQGMDPENPDNADLNGIRLASNAPIGQIDVRAKSRHRDYPVIPAGQSGALLDGTQTAAEAAADPDGQEIALALRVFDLKLLDVKLAPITLQTDMAAGRVFTVDAKLPGATAGAAPLAVKATIDALPAQLTLGLGDAPAAAGGGTQITWSASSPTSQIAIDASGVQLLEGADSLSADIRGVPNAFTVALPDQMATPKPPLARLAVTGANLTASGGPRIDELRLAAGAGGLPARAGNDKFTYKDGEQLNVGIKLTNVKGLSLGLDPINLVLDQEDTLDGGTKPIDLDALLPTTTPGPVPTVTGQLNKPSFHTELGVTIPASGSGQPNRLAFRNGTTATPRTMSSLAINAANLGTLKNAAFSLANIPQRLDACLATDGGCRPADRLPAALSNYGGYSGSPAANATAAGMNRPYAAQTSIDINDFGTSGTSAATGSMVKLNANLDLGDGNPISITDLYFHRIALDLGQNGTFGAFTTQIPRLYLFIDSQNKPYVMNSVKYPPSIQEFKIGTNASPATADRRLVWLPGGKCGGATVFGACVGVTVLDNRSSGAHSCGGQKNLSIKAGILGNVNVLDFPLVGQLVPVCS